MKIDALAAGGFSECSGLQLETEVQDFPEGGLNSHLWRFPGRTKQVNIVLKRGIVDKNLWTWYYQLTQGDFQPKDGSIVVRDQSGTRVMEWQFRVRFPASGPGRSSRHRKTTWPSKLWSSPTKASSAVL